MLTDKEIECCVSSSPQKALKMEIKDDKQSVEDIISLVSSLLIGFHTIARNYS